MNKYLNILRKNVKGWYHNNLLLKYCCLRIRKKIVCVKNTTDVHSQLDQVHTTILLPNRHYNIYNYGAIEYFL